MAASYKMKQMVDVLKELQAHMSDEQRKKLSQFELDIDHQKWQENREIEQYFAQDINGY